MKGIVFSEFIEMVEDKWDLDMVDDLIDDCDLASGGSYTSVGTYDHAELVALVQALSKRSGLPLDQLVHAFGTHLASTFTKKFPSFFAEVENTLELLKRIDNHIHVEVRKLYPDAELPKFSYEQPDDTTLLLHYESTRGFADLAMGLIEGTASHYGDTLSIERKANNENGTFNETFTIRMQ